MPLHKLCTSASLEIDSKKGVEYSGMKITVAFLEKLVAVFTHICAMYMLCILPFGYPSESQELEE